MILWCNGDLCLGQGRGRVGTREGWRGGLLDEGFAGVGRGRGRARGGGLDGILALPSCLLRISFFHLFFSHRWKSN